MQQQQPTVTEDEVDQTHCSVCSKHLRGEGVWCSICGFVHLKHTPLPSSKHWKPGLICNRCLPDSVVLADDISPQDLTHTGSAPERQSSGLSTNGRSHNRERPSRFRGFHLSPQAVLR